MSQPSAVAGPAGRGREAVQPFLVDLDPIAPAEVGAGGAAHRVQAVEHRLRHQGCCEDTDTTSPVMYDE